MTEKEILKGRIHMTNHESKSGNTYITADLDTGDNYPTRLIIFKKAIDNNPGITDLQDKDVEIEAYANQYSVQSITESTIAAKQPAANDLGRMDNPFASQTQANDNMEISDDDLPF
ncbi:hypothetical protein [Oenococcus oeni]|uniref:hypothetical protein n=1 Tax=Oenococcus oeni TaxID=1247 RepID=UPI0010B6B58F|nr:hypothetical protein [Oenococcus oeni]SYW13690.1 hypothetical protein OENI_1350007 [Oenococcus oeni]